MVTATTKHNAEQNDTNPPAILSYAELYTPGDKIPENVARRESDYERGLKTGMNAVEFFINPRGVWSTHNKRNEYGNLSSTYSYERLGYHANTAYFFAGVVASGVKITYLDFCGEPIPE